MRFNKGGRGNFSIKKSRLLGGLFSILLAFIIGGVLFALNGYEPLETYRLMFKAVFGTRNGVLQTLLMAQPLLFCGLAICITFKTGMFNIGSTGQLYMGALFACIVGVYVKGLPSIIHIPLCMLAGAVGGALWAFLPVWMRVRQDTSEVITALMMNYISQLFVSFMINYPMRDLETLSAQSPLVQESAMLPKIVPQQQLSVGIIIGFVLALLLHIMLKRTKLGFEMVMSGSNRFAATAAGIPANRVMISTMLMSGGIAGLGGAAAILGTHLRLVQGFAGNVGLEGVAVALFGNWPLGVIVSSVFFGALKTGITALNYSTNLSSYFIFVIEGLVIIFVSAPSLLGQLITWVQSKFKRTGTKANTPRKEKG